MNDNRQEPEDFEAMLRKFLSGQPLDPEQLAKAAGLPIDPKALQEMLTQPLLKKRLWQFMQNKMKES